MFGRHHRLYGHGIGWTPGVGDEQRALVCCGSWGLKQSDTTEWLNWTELSSNSSRLVSVLIRGEGNTNFFFFNQHSTAPASFLKKQTITTTTKKLWYFYNKVRNILFECVYFWNFIFMIAIVLHTKNRIYRLILVLQWFLKPGSIYSAAWEINHMIFFFLKSKK